MASGFITVVVHLTIYLSILNGIVKLGNVGLNTRTRNLSTVKEKVGGQGHPSKSLSNGRTVPILTLQRVPPLAELG